MTTTMLVRRVHELKTWPPFFEALLDGSKTFELRFDDRDFKVGDILILQEYENVNKFYTGRTVKRLITYKLEAFQGIKEGFCIMGLSMVPSEIHVIDKA